MKEVKTKIIKDHEELWYFIKFYLEERLKYTIVIDADFPAYFEDNCNMAIGAVDKSFTFSVPEEHCVWWKMLWG